MFMQGEFRRVKMTSTSKITEENFPFLHYCMHDIFFLIVKKNVENVYVEVNLYVTLIRPSHWSYRGQKQVIETQFTLLQDTAPSTWSFGSLGNKSVFAKSTFPKGYCFCNTTVLLQTPP